MHLMHQAPFHQGHKTVHLIESSSYTFGMMIIGCNYDDVIIERVYGLDKIGAKSVLSTYATDICILSYTHVSSVIIEVIARKIKEVTHAHIRQHRISMRNYVA